MLKLVTDPKDKIAAQKEFEQKIKAALRARGNKMIGFPGGRFEAIVHSQGDDQVWAAFNPPSPDFRVPRYWNGFGIYRPMNSSQTITVEINIATRNNSAQVAGFFARDVETDELILLHSAKIGGGRKGIGKSAYLVWSNNKLVSVSGPGKGRRGIIIGRLSTKDFVSRVINFVHTVYRFKEEVKTGKLQTKEFRRRVAEFDRYNREFSGKKQGSRSREFEYFTYHGDIVDELYKERSARKRTSELVVNSPLVDLLVKNGSRVTEIYEVKTSAGRQALYTAIGQLETHSSFGNYAPAKFLILPHDETISEDFMTAISALGIRLRRFKLAGKPSKPKIVLL